MYSLWLPYHPGKWRVVERVLKLFGLHELDGGKPLTVKRQGVRWALRKRCLVQRALYYLGAYEIHETRWLKRTLRADWCVLDVGANFGYYSLLIASATRDRATIHSFEPNPASLESLQENIRLNGFQNIHVHNLALSDQSGTLDLLVPTGGNEGLGHLRGQETVPPQRPEEVIPVQTQTLDEFVKSHGVDRLDFIKMDVEGAEAMVLKGAGDSLRRFRPLMMIEINPEALAGFGVSADWVLEQLRGLDYQTYRIHRGKLIPLHRADEFEHYVNAICLPR